MKRIIFASKEMNNVAKKSSNGKVQVYSFFPVDRGNCSCQPYVLEWKNKLAITPPDKKDEILQDMKYLTCHRDKTLMNRYEISCANCKEVLGYCWATDPTLVDFCDFHYTSWTNGEQWYGCLTPNISPISEELCLECTCGSDTRDFRANMTLSAKDAETMEKNNAIGRKYGNMDSKFIVRQVKNDMLPFKEK